MNRLSVKITAGVVVFNLLIVGIVLLLRQKLPPVVPLFYGLPLGEEQLAPAIHLSIPPLIAIAITLVNMSIIGVTKDKFLERILLGLMFTATALSAITVVKIIHLLGVI